MHGSRHQVLIRFGKRSGDRPGRTERGHSVLERNFIVQSDVPHPCLVHQLETVLGASSRAFTGSHGLLAWVKPHPGIVLDFLVVPTHGHDASRGVVVSRDGNPSQSYRTSRIPQLPRRRGVHDRRVQASITIPRCASTLWGGG